MDRKLYETGREIIQSSRDLYIDLDVEADGVAGHGSLLSIGATTPWGDNFYRELQPTSSVWLPGHREFCEKHGLQRERLLDEGIQPADAMADLADWVNQQKSYYQKSGAAVLTAFAASFDTPWIDLEMIRAGIDSPFSYVGFCIKSLAMKLSPDYSWESTRKCNLPADIRPDGDFTHHALEDAQYQQQINFALAAKVPRGDH